MPKYWYSLELLLFVLLLTAASFGHAAQEPGATGTSADAGELAFNNACRTCHTTKAGDNRLGPHLNGVVGRKSGSVEGYANYSGALKGGSITWDEATLDKFIANPEAVAPGNNMKPYTGISDAAQRAEIIAFLKSGGRK